MLEGQHVAEGVDLGSNDRTYISYFCMLFEEYSTLKGAVYVGDSK